MTTASFAMTADDFALRRTQGAKAQKRKNVRAPFTHTARYNAANSNRTSADRADDMMAGIVMDCMFSAIFPGLGSIFNGLSVLDAVDLYDTFRDATGPTPHERMMRRQQQQIMPAKPVSAMRQLLSIVFG